jgi:hypothetical protein
MLAFKHYQVNPFHIMFPSTCTCLGCLVVGGMEGGFFCISSRSKAACCPWTNTHWTRFKMGIYHFEHVSYTDRHRQLRSGINYNTIVCVCAIGLHCLCYTWCSKLTGGMSVWWFRDEFHGLSNLLASFYWQMVAPWHLTQDSKKV